MLLNPYRFGSNYVGNAVTFNGAAYLTRGADYSGASDSSQMIFSCWIKLNSGNGSTHQIATGGAGYNIQRSDTNKIHIQLDDGANSFQFGTASTYTTSSGWLHILASCDTNYSVGNKLSHLYIDDTSDNSTITDGSAFTADFTQTNHAIGATTSGGLPLRADIAEFYLAFGQYLDFSNSSNRRKFIDSDGYPVSLGSDGSTPTGVAPTVYLSGQSTTFATNKGTGGGMTTNGSLTDAGTSPSD